MVGPLLLTLVIVLGSATPCIVRITVPIPVLCDAAAITQPMVGEGQHTVGPISGATLSGYVTTTVLSVLC